MAEYLKQQDEPREEEKEGPKEDEVPEGTRLLSEEERVETLKNLKATRTELERALEKLPISLKTVALHKKKEELEKKMDELGRAIESFSKPKVFIALD